MTRTEQLVRDLLDAFNERDFEGIRAYITDDFRDHGAKPGTPTGADGYLSTLLYVTGVRQIRYEVHDVVASGEKVAIRATAHGVHENGRAYAMPTMHIFRAEGDRLAEHWAVRDELGALRQVGVATESGR